MARPIFFALAVWISVGSFQASAAGPRFEVSFTDAVSTKPVDGRVYLMLGAPNGMREPRTGPEWFGTQPFFAKDVKGYRPGDKIVFDADSVGYPGKLGEVRGEYRVQAVLRINPDTHLIGGAGNGYSPVVAQRFDGPDDGRATIQIDRVAPAPKFQEEERVKLVDIESRLLSDFHKRPIRMQAAVVLPPGDPATKRPTLYIVPGFGGDHMRAGAMLRSPRMGGYAQNLIRVVLNPDCGTGHHVFADSANNGPRGRALIEELIPRIEKTFPAIAEPKARLLNGHSSGGWSSLWLQAAYPDFFGGVWSTSPDPVDFRDFQRIDLYAKNANMFKDEQGKPRPLARMGGTVRVLYESFSRMEDVYGDGGQLHSFEAVFSPKGLDGRPTPLWDRATGAVNPEVAKSWEKYDIRLVLERNWSTLAPKLKGKLHIYTGEADTFYLEGAVKLLQASMEKLGSDASFLIVPGKDHGSILDPALIQRIDSEIRRTVREF